MYEMILIDDCYVRKKEEINIIYTYASIII